MLKPDSLKIIPKQKSEVLLWVRYVFLCSLALVFLSGSVYFFVVNKISTEQDKKDALEWQITAFRNTHASQGLRNSVVALSKKVEAFSNIFKDHKIISRFFDLLRASCHPMVQFTALDLNANDGRVKLVGSGQDFQVLGEQILIFKQDKNLKDVKVSDINLSKEGNVLFSISFSIEPDILSNSN